MGHCYVHFAFVFTLMLAQNESTSCLSKRIVIVEQKNMMSKFKYLI